MIVKKISVAKILKDQKKASMLAQKAAEEAKVAAQKAAEEARLESHTREIARNIVQDVLRMPKVEVITVSDHYKSGRKFDTFI